MRNVAFEQISSLQFDCDTEALSVDAIFRSDLPAGLILAWASARHPSDRDLSFGRCIARTRAFGYWPFLGTRDGGHPVQGRLIL
jgi:hypothetical protein